MAFALYLSLFCVFFQVMSGGFNALAAPHNLTSGIQPYIANMPGQVNPNDPDRHDKRSLSIWPYDEKYLSTTHHTLVIKPDGTVEASQELAPMHGILRLFTACTVITTLAHRDWTNEPTKCNKVYIRGEKTQKYVCMNSDGVVYASIKDTEECIFQQDGVGNRFRYSSVKYRGFKDASKRTKKRWYLGIKHGKVLLGHQTKKKKDYVKFMLRPVTINNLGTGFDPITTTPTEVGGTDRAGGIEVITSPKSDTVRPTTPKTSRRKKKKCDDSDPFNLLRFSRCSKNKQTRSNGGLFGRRSSRNQHERVRHKKNKQRSKSSRRQGPFNLLSTNRR